MKSEILQTALNYLAKGYSVIPIKPSKRPFIQWEEFKKKQPTQDEVREWWRKWPSANVAIITGKISGICAIDIDEDEGFEAIQDYIPDSLVIPTSKTPKEGQHLYFQMPEKSIGNNSRIIPGCDFRGEGGYIIAPPSKGYSWLDGLSIDEVEPPSLPSKYYNYLNTLYIKEYNKEHNIEKKLEHNKALQTITTRNITFDEPGRDESLFHLANHLVKGAMPLANIEKYLTFFAANCNPPFPSNEKEAKIKSALERAQRQKRNLTQEIREWLSITWGNISITNCIEALQTITFEERAKVTVILHRLVKEGLIEKVPDKYGWFRRVDNACEEMDFINTPTHTVDIAFPFEIEKKVELMPGNVVVIAGEVNAGKTAFLLNVVKENMNQFDIHYFSSEMGSSELRKRLSKFDIPLDVWNFKAKERSDNFADVIVGGEGRINIIDYLEIYKEFYLVSGYINEIYKKLNGAVAIIALQKNPGSDTGLGGFRSLEKPRLYLSMDRNKLKIVKAKNWMNPAENPNGQEITFKLVDGCKFITKVDWHLIELGDSV